MSGFGEVVEVYTNTAVVQLQRLNAPPAYNLKMTIAPLKRISGQKRKADFELKSEIVLNENGIANLATGLMGLTQNIKINGSRHRETVTVAYINVNQHEQTTNIIISTSANGATGTNQQHKNSIVFANTERFSLLRMAVSQLARNNVETEQTAADTLNLLKASVMRP